jgi:hypothetical protein
LSKQLPSPAAPQVLGSKAQYSVDAHAVASWSEQALPQASAVQLMVPSV